MSDTNNTQSTTVQEVDIDLDFLGTGAASIMTPTTGEPEKRGFFSPGRVDTSFLDMPPAAAKQTDQTAANTDPADKGAGTEDPATPPANGGTQTPPSTTQADMADIFGTENGTGTGTEEPGDDDKNKGGRPTAMVSALKSLVDKKVIFPFDDGKKIEEYSQADVEELIEANFRELQTNYQEEASRAFFASLPPELQQAYHYVANGGSDMKGLFQSLAASQEIQSLDTGSEQGRMQIVRAYLQATNWGTPEEIEDEVYNLQDKGELEKKANQFKPKLDSMQQQIVNQKVMAAEEANRMRAEQAAVYQDNVYKVLKGGEINGIKLDNRVQNLLYAGLVQPNYPSMTGKQTNLLGHLLEKHQFIEPRHDLIAEALWLLADPDGYRQELRKQGSNEATTETVRRLKMEQQAASNGGSHSDEPEENNGGRRPQTIARTQRNFFGRETN